MTDKQPINESDKIEIEEPLRAPTIEAKEEEDIKVPKRSRLSKTTSRKSRNTFIISTIGIVLILILSVKFGIYLLGESSFLFGRVTSTDKKEVNTTSNETFVPVPSLDFLPQATKEKNLKVAGSSISGLTIEVYLNGSKIGEVKADDNGDFEKEVNLTDGDNIIKARAVKEGKESDFSDSETVTLKNSGPTLSIDSPSDGADIHGGNPFQVKGKTDPDSSVTVNDFQAITDSSGNWSYYLTLVGGGNDIKVISVDAAGNKTDKSIHVNYSQ
jgi:hypothetical protein